MVTPGPSRSLARGDLSQALVVTFTLTGSAKNGTDYQHLNLQQKIRPNKASATIHVIPESDPTETATKAVKLKLQRSTVYQVGDAFKAKVNIVFTGTSSPTPN